MCGKCSLSSTLNRFALLWSYQELICKFLLINNLFTTFAVHGVKFSTVQGLPQAESRIKLASIKASIVSMLC